MYFIDVALDVLCFTRKLIEDSTWLRGDKKFLYKC